MLNLIRQEVDMPKNSKTVAFTKKAIDALPLPTTSGYTYYSHPSIPGLKVGVTQNGVKTFLIRKTINGRLECIILGNYNSRTFTPDNAIRKAQDVFKQINAGVNPNEQERLLSKDMTLKELLDEYISADETTRGGKVKASTARDKEYLLKKHLVPLFKHKLSLITSYDLRKLHASISQKAPISANRVIVWLSAMFTWAKNNGLFFGKNPAEKFSLKNKEAKRDRFLKTDELTSFLKQVDALPLTYKSIYYVLLFTGIRKSNALSLKWEYIDFDLGQIRLPDTKNNTPLIKKLDDGVKDLLLQLRTEQEESGILCEWVFPTNKESKTKHMQDIKHSFRSLLKRAKIKNFTIHDLRRTFASYMAMSGASQFLLSQALGHKDLRSIAVYARLTQEAVHLAEEKGIDSMRHYAHLKSSNATIKKSQTP